MNLKHLKTLRSVLLVALVASALSFSTACTMGGDYYANGVLKGKSNPDNLIPNHASSALMGTQAKSSEFATSENATCFIERLELSVRCFGSNTYMGERGLLGNPNFLENFSGNPQLVYKDVGNGLEVLGNARDIVAGKNHFCASTQEKQPTGEELMYVYCWGSNEFGQLANGSVGDAGTIMVGTAKRVSVAAGLPLRADISSGSSFKLYSGGDHSCVIQISTGPFSAGPNKIHCWGSNAFEQAGQDIDLANNTNVRFATEVQANTLTGYNPRSLALGETHSCVMATADVGGDNRVLCWGQNRRGRLGIDPSYLENKYEDPHEVLYVQGSELLPLASIVQISAVKNTTCAIQALAGDANRMLCWGEGAGGELGVNPTTLGANTYYSHAQTFVQDIGSIVKIKGSLNGNVFCIETNSAATIEKKCFGTLAVNIAQPNGPGLTAFVIPDYNVNPSSITWDALNVSDLFCGYINNLSFGATFGCAALDGGNLSCWGDNKELKLGNQEDAPYASLPVTDVNTQVVPVMIYQ